ncbi:hypothetical protein CR513_05056, partial [Mucuna pruriens]
MSPYRIVFGKACHLLVEIEQRAYWVVKQCNLTYDQKVKQFHDQQILRKEFQVGQKLIVGKLHSRWDGPFVITNVFPYGVVDLKDEHTNSTFQYLGTSFILANLLPIAPLFPVVWKERPVKVLANKRFIPLCRINPNDLDPSRRVSAQDRPALQVQQPLGVAQSAIQSGRPAQLQVNSAATSPWRSLLCKIRKDLIPYTLHSIFSHTFPISQWCFSRSRTHKSRTKRPKVVKGDYLACHHTLVDLILSFLANRGEPSWRSLWKTDSSNSHPIPKSSQYDSVATSSGIPLRPHRGTDHVEFLQTFAWIFTCKTMKFRQQMNKSRFELVWLSRLQLQILDAP